jgi:hypothetical protein
MTDESRAPAGIGCLSTVVGVLVLAGIAVLVFLVGFVVLAVVAGLALVGLVVWAIDRALLALSPARRERRAAQTQAFVWRFTQQPSGDVIDATAVDTSAPPDELGTGEPGPSRPPGH